MATKRTRKRKREEVEETGLTKGDNKDQEEEEKTGPGRRSAGGAPPGNSRVNPRERRTELASGRRGLRLEHLPSAGGRPRPQAHEGGRGSPSPPSAESILLLSSALSRRTRALASCARPHGNGATVTDSTPCGVT